MTDTTMPVIYPPAHSQHAPQVELWNGRLIAYAEKPQRVENIKQRLEDSGLVTLTQLQDVLTLDDVKKVHDPGMVDYLKSMSDQVETFLSDEEGLDLIGHTLQVETFLSDEDNFYEVDSHMGAQEYFYPATFPTRPWMARMRESTLGVHGYYCFDMEAPIGTGTWPATLDAASVAHEGAKLLLGDETAVAYALGRPPGHHSGPDFFGGYCYLNTAAIAADTLREMGKVAIVDIDYHHGNGTQAIFWNDPEVFFGSIHADPDQEYPYFSGYADEVGGSKARGTTANFPLRRRSSEEQYLQAFEELLDKALAFQPDVIVVSLGFDTYEKDPLGFFEVTGEGYFRMGKAFADLGLPLLLVQEGGYNIEALGELAEHFVRGVLEV